MYNLLLVSHFLFLGQYQSLDSCNQAVRSIIERKHIPYPHFLNKEELRLQQVEVDKLFKNQKDYLCVKQ